MSLKDISFQFEDISESKRKAKLDVCDVSNLIQGPFTFFILLTNNPGYVPTASIVIRVVWVLAYSSLQPLYSN